MQQEGLTATELTQAGRNEAQAGEARGAWTRVYLSVRWALCRMGGLIRCEHVGAPVRRLAGMGFVQARVGDLDRRSDGGGPPLCVVDEAHIIRCLCVQLMKSCGTRHHPPCRDPGRSMGRSVLHWIEMYPLNRCRDFIGRGVLLIPEPRRLDLRIQTRATHAAGRRGRHHSRPPAGRWLFVCWMRISKQRRVL